MLSNYFWEDFQNGLMVPTFVFDMNELDKKVQQDSMPDKKYIWYLLLGVATAEEYREKRHPLHNWAWLKGLALTRVSQING